MSFQWMSTLLGGGGLPNICNDSSTLLKATGYRCPEHKCTLQTVFLYLSQKILARMVGTGYPAIHKEKVLGIDYFCSQGFMWVGQVNRASCN